MNEQPKPQLVRIEITYATYVVTNDIDGLKRHAISDPSEFLENEMGYPISVCVDLKPSSAQVRGDGYDGLPYLYPDELEVPEQSAEDWICDGCSNTSALAEDEDGVRLCSACGDALEADAQ